MEGQWKPLNEKEDGRATGPAGFVEYPCQLTNSISGACTLFSQIICIRINLLLIFDENQIRKNIRKIWELGRLIEKLGRFLIIIRFLIFLGRFSMFIIGRILI
jgi:hypothetical protein